MGNPKMLYGIIGEKINSQPEDVHVNGEKCLIIAHTPSVGNQRGYFVIFGDNPFPVLVTSNRVKMRSSIVGILVYPHIIRYLNEMSDLITRYETQEKAREILAENSEKSREK